MHYMNGREAKVGDLVVGKTFNVPMRVAGTLVSLTPGVDACSAKVGYLATMPLSAAELFIDALSTLVRVQGSQQHGSAGEKFITTYREDYTECKNLMHADDVAGYAVAPEDAGKPVAEGQGMKFTVAPEPTQDAPAVADHAAAVAEPQPEGQPAAG